MVAEQKPNCTTCSSWTCGLEGPLPDTHTLSPSMFYDILKIQASLVSSLGRMGLAKVEGSFFTLLSEC